MGPGAVRRVQTAKCLVLSPLVSLMVDQVSGLQKRGVSAAILSGNKDVEKKLLASESDVSKGRFSLLYSSPEAILGIEVWKQLLVQRPLCDTVVAVAVDEAHCVYKWSKDFRPVFDRIRDLRAFVPPYTPFLAATATVTKRMRDYVVLNLGMAGCFMVSESPNKPNISYEAVRKTSIEEDFAFVVADVLDNNIKARRIVVYCQSLNMCASLYEHFKYTLKDAGYYPPGAEQISDNRMFGMFHSCTDEHNKAVIMESLGKPDGVVRIVFATMAIGMGVDFKNLDFIIHYGAPRSLEDYFQESGRAGRDNQQSLARVYWKPAEAPVRADLTIPRNLEWLTVRDYLENTELCRRFMLLKYFDPVVAKNIESRDKMLCCDNCRSSDVLKQ